MTFRKGGAKKRRDANESGIVKALEAVGCRVFRVSGRGLPDLLIYRRGRCYAVEVKTAKGLITPAQDRAPWPIVRTPDEALLAVGAIQDADVRA